MNMNMNMNMNMTTIEDVKKVMDGFTQDNTVIRLKNDENFLMTVAMLYDDYLYECKQEGIEPKWDLERYTLDKVEWEESE